MVVDLLHQARQYLSFLPRPSLLDGARVFPAEARSPGGGVILMRFGLRGEVKWVYPYGCGVPSVPRTTLTPRRAFKTANAHGELCSLQT